ncbi:hypothetical protein Tco_1482693 [Tanacetum coccineum]
MEMKDTLSSCSNLEEQQMQQIQDKAKRSCMVSFQILYSHLKLLSNNDLKGTRTEHGFIRAVAKLFRQDVQTCTGIMLLNVDQLEQQLDKEEFQEIGSMATFRVQQFRDTLIQHMESVKKSIEERALHIKEYDSRVNERQMQTTEGKVDTSKALDVSLVDIESNETESGKQDTSSSSGNDAHGDDADIRPIYDEEPMAELSLVDIVESASTKLSLAVLYDDEASYHEDASDSGTATNKPKQQQQQVTPITTTISNIKLPILKKEEYDIWAMEMEHYLEYIDNDAWKVIQNGNSKKIILTGKDGVVRILLPVSTAEIHAAEKERKARTILLMAIPKEHLRRFHGMDEAKEI